MRPSLLDRADLPALRNAPSRLPGAWGSMVACMLVPGALQYDPDDPAWPDRDRLVVGDPAADAALRVVSGADGIAVPGPHALAFACGLALAFDLDGSPARVWCLLGADAATAGGTYDAAAALADASARPVVLVLAPAGEANTAETLFATAGWRLARARADEPLEVLGALDRALAATAPIAVLAVTG